MVMKPTNAHKCTKAYIYIYIYIYIHIYIYIGKLLFK
jgi:hypothetical protein